MQLIFDTENPSVHINEKMSTLNPETDRSLPNGDMKGIVEEVDGKPESDGTSDKENVESKGNNLIECDVIENQDEAEGLACADKSKEPLNLIQEPSPMEVSTLTVEKESKQDNLIQNIVTNEEKTLHVDNLENLELGKKVGPLTEDNEESESDAINILKFNETKEQELEKAEKLELYGKENLEQDKTENVEVDKTEKLELDESEKLYLSETEEEELEQAEKLELDEKENLEQDKTENDAVDKTEKLELDESEKLYLSETEEQQLEEAEKLELNGKENLEQDKKENVEQDKTENVEVDKTEKLELDESEKLYLSETEDLELDKTDDLELDKTEDLELDKTEDLELVKTEDLEKDKIEKLEAFESEKFKDKTDDKENEYKPEDTENLKIDDKEELELEEIEKRELSEIWNPKLKDLEQNVAETQNTVETEKLKLDEMDKVEHDSLKSLELSNTDKSISNNTENRELVYTEKTQQQQQDHEQELDDSVKNLSDVAEKKVLTIDVPVETNLSESIHIVQETVKVTEKADMPQAVDKKADPMEIDEGYSFSIDQELEDSSEKYVTQSISDMVENIVQNLNEDTADDLMDGIEIDHSEKVVQKTDEANNVKDSSANPKTKIMEITQEDKMKQKETEQIETITELEEDENKMEIDQEHNVNKITEIPKHNSEMNAIANTSLSSQQVPPAAVVHEDIIKDVKIPQELIEGAENTEITSNESNKIALSEISDKGQSSIDSNIKLDDTSVKENNTVLLNGNKIARDDADSSSTSHLEKKRDEIDVMGNDSEESKLKGSDFSGKNLENSEPTITEAEDDIISSNVDKATVNASKDVESKIPAKQNEIPNADDTSDVEEVKLIEVPKNISAQTRNEKTPEKVIPLIKLSNTMNILSDEEEERLIVEPPKKVTEPSEKCINLDDDDDIMLIDDDAKEEKKESQGTELAIEKFEEPKVNNKSETNVVKPKDVVNKISEVQSETDKESTKPETHVKEVLSPQPETENSNENVSDKPEKSTSLIPGDLFKSYRKNLADMTRDDLEEFCILKIVESIIDRSNLNEIRSKLKSMGQTIEEYKKKAMMLTKQNRDLQVVLKSVQEEQKKSNGTQPITPLKITRSVGMQVLMTDKSRRRIMPGQAPPNVVNNVSQANNRNVRNTIQSPRNTPQKAVNNLPIPVPRLVPAGPSVVNKAAVPATPVNTVAKAPAAQNGVKNISPAQKPEKRTHNRMQSQSSAVTVDLTDDEPPSKIPSKSSPAPPVRLVNQQNLIAPRQQFSQQVNSPRKVYIPISINNGPQTQTVRPGQTIMLKTVSAQGPRPRGPAPSMVRPPQNVQVRRLGGSRHPAPLPDAMKQYQPPNWKALPPAPDLKLSKVENGIVISWKIEGYQEDSYEEIASYQLYAYQETSAPPSTNLWKKIGDVKALPLPMACTLTQFMAGYKYYFAVRAVDIRSRFGPFSLPGSILLLNKM